MKERTHLLFYYEDETAFTDKIRAEFFNRSIPFLEISNKSDFFDALESKNYNIVMQINSQNMCDKIIDVAEKQEIPSTAFIIISEKQLQCSRYILTNKLDDVIKYILSLALTYSINMRPINHSVIHKVVSAELEKIGITKTYIGFKYIVDLIVLCLKDRKSLIPLDAKLDKVALVNSINKASVERDIRHMLNTCWKNNEVFRNVLLSIDNYKFILNFKNLLSYTIKYFLTIV